jgi:hypothetical protein
VTRADLRSTIGQLEGQAVLVPSWEKLLAHSELDPDLARRRLAYMRPEDQRGRTQTGMVTTDRPIEGLESDQLVAETTYRNPLSVKLRVGS